VVVHHAGRESRIAAGEGWPRGCAGAPRGARAAAPSAPVSASSLAEQNDLFASAVAAKQSGEGAVALARFEAFVRRYPASPLAENASVERMRLLRATDPARARVAARAYLGRWPDGFARSEAEGVLSGAR
jgi:hypothetical protein